jgi:5-methylcytosine-specific restriction protein A
MARNPAWTRDELILALELYLRHRERLPDNDDAEIVELSAALNALFGKQAKDAALFRNSNGVYMKLANFRAVDPLHTSQGKRGLSRGGSRRGGDLGGVFDAI